MVLSRIHDCFAAEVARTSTTPLLLLEHLSGTQEAELPPTGVYHSSCCCHSQCAGILCCGGSRGISASPAEIPLPENKPTSPTAAAAAKDFSRIFYNTKDDMVTGHENILHIQDVAGEFFILYEEGRSTALSVADLSQNDFLWSV